MEAMKLPKQGNYELNRNLNKIQRSINDISRARSLNAIGSPENSKHIEKALLSALGELTEVKEQLSKTLAIT